MVGVMDVRHALARRWDAAAARAGLAAGEASCNIADAEDALTYRTVEGGRIAQVFLGNYGVAVCTHQPGERWVVTAPVQLADGDTVRTVQRAGARIQRDLDTSARALAAFLGEVTGTCRKST